jgi:hypothetical protein
MPYSKETMLNRAWVVNCFAENIFDFCGGLQLVYAIGFEI